MTGKKAITLLVFLFASVSGNAQYENVWIFGKKAGLDFNTGVPIPLQTNINGWGEANASICDNNGQLLFYTEGSNVWDKNGNLMPNGSNLTSLGNATSSTSQGAIIVPMIANPLQYYIFSLTAYEEGDNMGRLYYSIVDIELNGGLGDIPAESKGILLDSNLLEKMTAIVGDQCNIWLLTQSDTKFKAFEITASGINTIPVISDVLDGSIASFTGSIVASPNRKKIAVTQCNALGLGINGAAIYDFNPVTGSVSNPLQLAPANSGYGACFSPDNTKLYINQGTRQRIVQYDLSHRIIDDIRKSETVLGQNGLTHLKLGPDGKIYMLGSEGYLSVINLPNNSGMACQFVQDDLALLDETAANLGLPHTVPVIPYDTFLTMQLIEAGCFANELLLKAKDDVNGYNYTWNDGSVGPSLAVDTAGIYWVQYQTPPCVYHIDTFIISFPNGTLPKLDIQSACKNEDNGKAFIYTNPDDTVIYHYTWRNGENQILSTGDTLQGIPSSNYFLQIKTINCDTTLEVIVPKENYFASFTADSIVCKAEEIEFQNTSDSHFNQFSWSFGDTSISSLQNPSHIYNQAGEYEIIMVGIGEICNDTARQIIVVDPKIEAYFVKDKDSICVGESISFTHEMDRTTITHLNWQMGDGNDLSVSDNNLMHAYERAGTMPVTLRSQFRVCPESAFTDTVYVFALPKVDLGADTSICLNGTPVILKNRFLSSNSQRFLWSTGDTSEMLKIAHPGTYSLKISEAPLGCSNTETIEIKKACYLDIPNAFTPNGDGENDYFFPRQLLSQRITQFHMKILNRWGQVVFETENVNGRGWDGKFNGKEQSGGVYVYLLDVEIDGLSKERYQGNVTLIK